MTKITCNGYRWRIKKIDKRSETQNSGVLVNSCTDTGDIAYYGILTEIIELSYPQGRSVILFRCDWVHPIRGVKQDEFGFTLVNIKSHWKTSEPFVLASQAVQVFYVPESKEKNWHVVIATKPRDLYDLEDDVIPEVEVLQVGNSTSIDAEEFVDVREDIVGVTLNEPFVDSIERNNDVEIDSNNSSAESDEDDETLYDFNSE